MIKRWESLGSPLILLFIEQGLWCSGGPGWEASRHGGEIWPLEVVVDPSLGRKVVRDLEGWVGAGLGS